MSTLRAVALGALLLAPAGWADDTAPRPSPEYAPAEVVGIVLRALATPDEPSEDAGIETTFRFASPQNRAQTGPLERFKRLVENRVYAPLLGHERAVRGDMAVDGERARERVQVIAGDGTRAEYGFVLSRQPTDAECGGCWMTDAVIRVKPEGQAL